MRRLADYEVIDMRFPERPGRKLGNVDSLFELMQIIYQIRCNLFHGKKSMDDPHDLELVQLAYRILSRIYRPFVENEAGYLFPTRVP